MLFFLGQTTLVCAWLPLEEWWYNTFYHTTTKMAPYETVYIQQPLVVTSYILGTSKVSPIDNLLKGREATLTDFKDNLHMDQNCMKQVVD
jgi:hypothetical protein